MDGVLCVCVCVCVLATSYGMQDPSSLSRDWTSAPYFGSMESSPLGLPAKSQDDF